MHILFSYTKRLSLSLSQFFFSIFCWIFYEVYTLIVLLLTNLYVFHDASICFSYYLQH